MSFPILKAPFPWFGGKSRVAPVVWERFGDVTNYVEPFAGSLAVLLGRPTTPKTETVNDLDCYLANFWRATAIDPEGVAEFADWPVNEADLHARHLWLVKQDEFRERMKTDPEFYDARVAGWWVWGLCQWIGSGWCSRPEWTGRTNAGRKGRGILAGGHNGRPGCPSKAARIEPREMLGRCWASGSRLGTLEAVPRQIPELSTDRGVHRQLPSAQEMGIHRKLPHLKIPNLGDDGRGVNVKRPMLSGNGHGVGVHSDRGSYLLDYFEGLRERLRRVRVCCGDWKRVTWPSVTEKHDASGIFLDPPYDMRVVLSKDAGRDGAAASDAIYGHHDNDLAADVRNWALANGENPLLRIALCGYEEEHGPHMPASWECFRWKAQGGYGSQNADGNVNAERERIWFSPYCLRPQETFQFDEVLAL